MTHEDKLLDVALGIDRALALKAGKRHPDEPGQVRLLRRHLEDIADAVNVLETYWAGAESAANAIAELRAITIHVERDGCKVCAGERGGVPGNENVIDGVVMCDYCHGDQLK